MKYNETTFTTSPKRLKRLLSRFEAITEANCVFTIAEIHGHTNTEGDADANMELSRRRAVAVQEWLGQQGYPADTAEIIAHGENDLFIQTGDGVRKTINDRVYVIITGISHPPDSDPNRPPYDCPACMEKQGYPIPH
ncbi:MAG: OmpA family protein [Robiginitomaculum sp.]|nr:OmpA family protein [Robiginitomaculum sp.]